MLYFVHANGQLAAIAFDETTARRIGSMLVKTHARNVLVKDIFGTVLYFSR